MSNMESKEQQILEGNKLIAEFLGFKFHKKLDIDFSDCGGIYDRTDVWSKVEILSEDYPESDQFYISDEWKPAIGDVIYGELEYHENWSWLMPVVEKIEAIYDKHHGYFGIHISSNSCSIQGTYLHKAIKNLSEYGYVYMSDPNAIFSTKIESTWYNVVEFIKWYNDRR